MKNELINELLTRNEEKLLSFEEEQEIFKLLENNIELREDVQTIMIKNNMRLIYSIAKDYYPITTMSSDDIVQLGMIGVSKAVDKFDYKKQVRFSSYATYWIKQSISRGLHKALYDTDQSFNIKELRKKFYETEKQLLATYKRNITFDEVANKMGIKPSELLVIFHSANLESLDKTIDEKNTFMDQIADDGMTPQEFVLNNEKNELIYMAMESLTLKEQAIIKYRYGYEDGIYHSFSDIAEKFGFSRQRAQVIEKNALNKMREFFEEIK